MVQSTPARASSCVTRWPGAASGDGLHGGGQRLLDERRGRSPWPLAGGWSGVRVNGARFSFVPEGLLTTAVCAAHRQTNAAGDDMRLMDPATDRWWAKSGNGGHARRRRPSTDGTPLYFTNEAQHAGWTWWTGGDAGVTPGIPVQRNVTETTWRSGKDGAAGLCRDCGSAGAIDVVDTVSLSE